MATEQQEQNRNEEATPFKLRRARERGTVARSPELGFLGSIVALTAFLSLAGESLAHKLAQMTRDAFAAGIDQAADPEQTGALAGDLYWSVLQPVVLLGGTIVAVVALLEIVQLRGLIFTTHPLKPDFSRLNPATGLKRLLSPRMFKETLKSLLKAIVYGTATWLVIADAIDRFALVAAEGERLAATIGAAVLRLLFTFIAIAVGFAILDQLLVRGEFSKQMRMSRREVTRETKDREGDPRIRQKRKQLHREFVAQTKGMGDLAGSDLLVVNPEHFAVALRYDPATMAAPSVTAKGRNHFALALREAAARQSIPVLARPKLARLLYRQCETGVEVPPATFEAVAELYIHLRREAAPAPQQS